MINIKGKLISAAVIVTVMLSLYSWYSYNKARVIQLESEVQLYKESFESASNTIHEMTTQSIKQSKELNTLYSRNQEARRRTQELEILLSKHNLKELAKSKPKMIETRINAGTEEVFKYLEDLTKLQESKE